MIGQQQIAAVDRDARGIFRRIEKLVKTRGRCEKQRAARRIGFVAGAIFDVRVNFTSVLPRES
jgi:hypothetical protein